MKETRGSDLLPNGLDERLRQALEPRPEAVERLVRSALAPPARPERRLRLAPAVPVVAALLLAVLLLSVRPEHPARPAPISIENVGDVLVVRSPEGGHWIVSSGDSPGNSSPSGTLIVTYGGDR